MPHVIPTGPELRDERESAGVTAADLAAAAGWKYPATVYQVEGRTFVTVRMAERYRNALADCRTGGKDRESTPERAA